MPQNAVKGAPMTCTMGKGAPPQLIPIPVGPPVEIEGNLAGTVMDFKPMANIPSFGLCTSPTNPEVAAAKSPQPCMPVIMSPWAPGSSTVQIYGLAALLQTDKCQCTWGGTITFIQPGQTTATSAP